MRCMYHVARSETVKKFYGKGLNATTALNQMNLSVGAGEFVAIMGESGVREVYTTKFKLLTLMD